MGRTLEREGMVALLGAVVAFWWLPHRAERERRTRRWRRSTGERCERGDLNPHALSGTGS
jgi:hypothetical protein